MSDATEGLRWEVVAIRIDHATTSYIRSLIGAVCWHLAAMVFAFWEEPLWMGLACACGVWDAWRAARAWRERRELVHLRAEMDASAAARGHAYPCACTRCLAHTWVSREAAMREQARCGSRCP